MMQRWEYIMVEIPHNLGKMKIEGGKIESQLYINQLGEEGWELVGIEQTWPGSALSDYILFFKRPR
jgi:hypothetical protein